MQFHRVYSRKTKNTKRDIEKISDEFIQKCKIENGDYDIVTECKNRIPRYWELGRTYQRLIPRISKQIDTLEKGLGSWIIEKIIVVTRYL